MTCWHDGAFAGFDTETTGADPETARIVTAAVVTRGTADDKTLTWLLNPGIDIPDEATAIHGITTGHAREHGMDAATAVAEIADAVAGILTSGLPLVIFNAPFDLTLLDRETRRHGITPFANAVIIGGIVDPYVLDKHVDRYRKGSRKLETACAHYSVTIDGAHNATEDALAAMRVAWRIGQVHPGLARLSLRELHQLQITAKAEQSASFADYLARTGKPEAVDGSWPIRLPAETTAAA